jgi:hypothetical protein
VCPSPVTLLGKGRVLARLARAGGLQDHFEHPNHILSIDLINNVHAAKIYGARLMAHVRQLSLLVTTVVHL